MNSSTSKKGSLPFHMRKGTVNKGPETELENKGEDGCEHGIFRSVKLCAGIIASRLE